MTKPTITWRDGAPFTNITIPLTDCKDRHLYRIASRNLISGVFSKETSGFVGIREKFGRVYLFEEYHVDTGKPYGTASPYEDLGEIPSDLEVKETEDVPGEPNRVRTYGALFEYVKMKDAEYNKTNK